jgi:hypothetical protein
MKNNLYLKKDKPCDKFESCQIPEEKTSVCFNCGFLRKEHKKGEVNIFIIKKECGKLVFSLEYIIKNIEYRIYKDEVSTELKNCFDYLNNIKKEFENG